MLKSTNDNTSPWGTPCRTFLMVDRLHLNSMKVLHPLEHCHLSVEFVMLEARMSSSSTEMLMVSKAGVRFRITSAVRSASFGLLKPVLIFCTMMFNAVVVEHPRQKLC